MRRAAGAGVALSALLMLRAAAALEPAVDLEALGADAAGRGVPILLAVTRRDCGYCATLRREILEPLRLAGDDPRRVLIRELMVDGETPVVAFGGRPTTAQALAAAYDAPFTPTVLLLGPDGAELAGRIVGINTPEMYGWYLDRSIDEATAALRRGRGDAPAAGAGDR